MTLQVEFWFDVGCEWTWLSAEWIRQVARHRDIEVRWRVYSLTMRKLGDEQPEAGKSFTLGAARMLEAVWADHGDDAIGPLYERIGHAVHVSKAHRDSALLANALTDCGLDPSYADSANEARWDSEVRGSMADADSLAGSEVAVPIIALGDEPTRAFSGPVLARRLSDDDALTFWDAYLTIVSQPAFFELKRHRSESPQI